MCWWQCYGLVVVVRGFEGDGKNGGNGVCPAIRFGDCGEPFDGICEGWIPQLDVVDVRFQDAVVDRIPEADDGMRCGLEVQEAERPGPAWLELVVRCICKDARECPRAFFDSS